MSYKQARKDFEYLETIMETMDWVEVMSRLTELMENPTKACAEGLYTSLILQWFSEFRADYTRPNGPVAAIEVDAKLKRIAKRHGVNLKFL